MKVSYPLSFKVSVWLVLNLLLLAAATIGFFVVRGGLGWSALLAGPAGEHVQAAANALAAEAAAATPDTREAVLARYRTTNHADYFLLRADDEAAALAAGVPPEVRARLQAWAPRLGGPGEFGRPFGESRMGGPGGQKRREPPPDNLARDPGDPRRTNEIRRGPIEGGERERGRFIVRTGSPATYWIALRAGFFALERARPAPTFVLIHVSSLWGLLRVLDLQSWLVAGTAVLALSIVFWLPLVHGITHALSQLTSATERIADGHFDARVPARRRDEIGRLGESVNRMATRIDAHLNGQKRFLGDVAHELCSPLARLQMATGILADRAPAELHETVSDVRDEVQQMSTLVNELLAFTKAGMQASHVTLADLEIAPLVQQAVARENGEGRITVVAPAHLRARGDAVLVSRAVGNLVRNALRYAPDGGPVAITVQPDGSHVSIAVEDEGPGVPADALDRLGEPFFRPELARTRESGGVGLGLSIVRSAMQACGGEVRFANRQPHGFRAELRLVAA
jgi:two-component system sensor histidine kinase CpxA